MSLCPHILLMALNSPMTELSAEVETEALGSVWLLWGHTVNPQQELRCKGPPKSR